VPAWTSLRAATTLARVPPRTQSLPSLGREFDALVSCRPDLIADPYPFYRRLRDEAPVYLHADQVVVSTFDDVSRLLLDSSTFLNGHAGLRGSRVRANLDAAPPHRRRKMVEILEFRGGGLNHLNGEQHERLRVLAHKAFTPRRIREMEERIQKIADDLLDKVAPAGEMEVISDFAFQLPLIVICEMLDVPPDDRYRIRKWVNDIAAFQDGSNPAVVDDTHSSFFALRDHLQEIFERRRGGPTTDLMGALLAAEGESGDRFAEDELLPVVAHFVFAGHETTTNLIGNSLRALLTEYRDQWELLRRRPDLVPDAIEELLRYDTSVQLTNRTAAEDAEIAGVPVRQWQTVTLMLGAANRDPRHFDEPDRVDVTRAESRHLGFGLGPHFCLGAALTRLEATVALRTLVRRFPDMRVAAPTVVYRADHRLRGVESLPVVLGPEGT
jgi:cytochrome P450